MMLKLRYSWSVSFSNNFSFHSHLKFRAMQGLIWSSNVLSFYSPLNVQNLSHNPQRQPREAAHWSTQRFHSLHASTDAAFWTLPICEAASWSASVALKTVLQYHATKQKEIDRQIDRQMSWGTGARMQFEPLGEGELYFGWGCSACRICMAWGGFCNHFFSLQAFGAVISGII